MAAGRLKPLSVARALRVFTSDEYERFLSVELASFARVLMTSSKGKIEEYQLAVLATGSGVKSEVFVHGEIFRPSYTLVGSKASVI
jgi:hypothetical protein